LIKLSVTWGVTRALEHRERKGSRIRGRIEDGEGWLVVLTGEAEVAVVEASNLVRRQLSGDQLGQDDHEMECRVARPHCEKKTGVGEKGGDSGTQRHLNDVIEGGMEMGVQCCAALKAFGAE
jgi:hypothetical protein